MVSQANKYVFLSFFLQKSFQKKEQLATWLTDERLIHSHTNLFFSIKFKNNLSGTIRNICFHRYSFTPKVRWIGIRPMAPVLNTGPLEGI